jgi:hypothetical protein
VNRVLLILVALAATAGLGGATRADAAVLGVETTCDKYMSCSYVVSYTADSGERNDVRFSFDERFSAGGASRVATARRSTSSSG